MLVGEDFGSIQSKTIPADQLPTAMDLKTLFDFGVNLSLYECHSSVMLAMANALSGQATPM